MTQKVLPFVVGCGRSGTTLVRAMLSAHPEVAVAPESYFVVPAVRLLHNSWNAGAFTRLVLGAESFGEWDLPHSAVRDAAAAASNVGEALVLLYRSYAESVGAGIGADKTPYHVLHLPRLATSIPEARFIHLIRDGRDVASSLVAMPFGPTRLGAAALYWERHVARGRAAGESLGYRYLEVRYEDLVGNPEPILGELCRFLSLPFAPSMLRYWEHADNLLGPLRRSDHLEGIRQPPALTRDWRTMLPPRDLSLVEALVGGSLVSSGYELAAGRPELRLQAAAALERVRAASRRAIGRGRAKAVQARTASAAMRGSAR